MESWLLRAAAEAPDRREAWVELAQLYYHRNDWPSCYSAAKRALCIKEKPLEYICDAAAWGSIPNDLAAIAAFRLGMYQEAVDNAQAAVDIDPSDERLKKNLAFCVMAFDGSGEK